MLGNIETEKAFIACVLHNNKLYYKFPLDKTDFVSPDCIQIWSNIVDLLNVGKPADHITVSSHRSEKMLAPMGVFIAELIDYNLTYSSVGHYHEAIKKFSTLRKFKSLEKLIPQILSHVGNDPTEAFDKLDKTLTDMMMSNDTKTVCIQDVYREVLEDIKTPKEKPSFYKTGLTDLDNIISGWRNGNLDIIAARPRTGKTASALFFAYVQAICGRKVFFHSGEMTLQECMERLLSIESQVLAKRIKDRQLNQIELTHLMEAQKTFNPMNWSFCDKPRIHINELELLIKKLKYSSDIDIVFIDQLSKIYGGTGFKKHEQIEDIASRLKALAKELDIPIILLAQINRTGAEKPTLEHLKDSGAIEQEADVVILLHRPEFIDPTPDNKGVLEINIAKDRHGEGGEQRFMFITQTQTITELGRI